MTETVQNDRFRYDLRVQSALLGVVREVLVEVTKAGLPGDHHFFLTFQSRAPGVQISSRLTEQYPEEMTIVLQHQFWDLAVADHAFDVGLSFNGVPERLHVPFAALTGFYDPSVKFGLKFAPDPLPANGSGTQDLQPAPEAKREPAARPLPAALPKAPSVPVIGSKAKLVGTEKPSTPQAAAMEAPIPAPAALSEGEGASKTGADGAEVVSLDAFRKKK